MPRKSPKRIKLVKPQHNTSVEMIKPKFICCSINVTTFHHPKASRGDRNGTILQQKLISQNKDRIQTHRHNITIKKIFVHTVKILHIKMDFIAQQRSLNVNIATKLDISPIAASRNIRIETRKETMTK